MICFFGVKSRKFMQKGEFYPIAAACFHCSKPMLTPVSERVFPPPGAARTGQDGSPVFLCADK